MKVGGAGPFRFSPRSNRANEIKWNHWGEEAFSEARRLNRLLLLSISAVWCHWCHVMDETTYSDQRVIQLLNNRFIPIRVDNDQRPDINLRYNLGGWPTTAILSPDGELQTGGTFLPPEALLKLLQKAESAWKGSDGNRKRLPIHGDVPDAWEEVDGRGTDAVPAGREPGRDKSDRYSYAIALESVKEEFDPKYAGFGQAPKFPMFQAIELAMDAFASTGDEECREIFTRTIMAMSAGGMYDPIEGGFFRYSTTRDWGVPHYEKMLEDNALHLELLIRAWQLTDDERFRSVADDVVRYLKASLYLPESGAWAGSQDADEEYYQAKREEREKRPAPFIDPLIYVEWNALLARALLLYARSFDSREWRDRALATLRFLHDRCFYPEKGMARYYDGQAHVYGLLADQTAAGRAALLAYESTGDTFWLEWSRQLASYCLKHLRTPDGLFSDRPSDRWAPGALSRPVTDFQANANAARWLIHLAQISTPDEAARLKDTAAHIINWGARRVSRYGLHGSGMALAGAELENEWAVVEIPGTGDPHVEDYVNLILGTYHPRTAIRYGNNGSNGEPVARVCRGNTCFPPARSVKELSALLEGPAKVTV